MQRLLTINNTKVDLDDNTAIGITLQSYDVKQPGKLFINISNSFTVPATSNNLNIFGNAQSPYSNSGKIYESSSCNYWVDNEQLIKDARVRVEYINNRIGLFIFQKPSVWDEIKKVKWQDFAIDLIKWLQNDKGLPSKSNQYIGTFQNFIAPYATATEGIKLPFYFGNLYNYDPANIGDFAESDQYIYLTKWDGIKANGGHLCVYFKTIFEYIEQKYNVDFLTSGSGAVGNIWDDAIAKRTYTPIRDLFVISNSTGTSHYFKFDGAPQYLPIKDVKDKAGKTLYDAVTVFFQHFNVIKDELEINGRDVIRLSRFDDMKASAPVYDFSGKFSGQPKFIPYINGYQQENTIKFKEVFPEGDKLQNSRVLTSNNLNLNATGDLFEIDAYVPGVIVTGEGAILDLSVKESFKTFQVLLDDDEINSPILVYNQNPDNIQVAQLRLNKAAIYSLSGEYLLLDEILKDTRVYEWEKWLTLNDIKNFEFFRQNYIKELGGSFFINKISGFNPQRSNKPTKIELIKISDNTPLSPPDLNIWVDGVNDSWVDGINDVWY